MRNGKLDIRNREHLKNAVAFARQLGGESKRSFLHCLRTVNRFKRSYDKPGVIFFFDPDWVKHSFAWGAYKVNDNRECLRGITGGMILHGFEETFSVTLDPVSYPRWSIHT